MEELLSLAQKLSGLSFATLLVLILAGSYFRKWLWTYQAEERVAEIKATYEKRIGEYKADLEEWKQMARGTSRVAESAVEKLKERS